MSSADRMKIDYAMVADLEVHLTDALAVLSMDIESSAVVAASCGDGRLGVAIVEFCRSWNRHRYDIKADVEWLRDSLSTIASQLSDVDAALATALAAPASSCDTIQASTVQRPIGDARSRMEQ